MDDSPRFRISWQIDDRDWEKARLTRQQNEPSSDYDVGLTPLYDLLYGHIQFNYGDLSLFPEQNGSGNGIRLSILDIAVQLSQTLFTDQFTDASDGAVASFVVLEYRVRFSFEKRQNHIIVRTDLPESRELIVPQDLLLHGIRDFLTEFLREIRRRAPALLEWHTVESLRAF